MRVAQARLAYAAVAQRVLVFPETPGGKLFGKPAEALDLGSAHGTLVARELVAFGRVAQAGRVLERNGARRVRHGVLALRDVVDGHEAFGYGLVEVAFGRTVYFAILDN